MQSCSVKHERVLISDLGKQISY